MNMRELFSCLWMATLLVGCTADNEPLLPPVSEQPQNIGAHLKCILHSRLGLWNSTPQLNGGKTLLFDHALLSSSAWFDTHYKLPYRDVSTGVVEGCLIYKVEDVPFPGSPLPEELQSPINLTAQLLNELPIGPSYHNSAVFKQWKKEGLNVSGRLVAVADSVDAEEAVKRRKDVSARGKVVNPDAIDCVGDFLVIKVQYEIIYGSHPSGGIVSLLTETLRRVGEDCANMFFPDALEVAVFSDVISELTIWVENNGYFKNNYLSTRVSEFMRGLASMYVKEGIEDFLYTYRYSTYYRNFPIPDLWIDDGKDLPKGGGEGGSGGGSGSSEGEENEEPDPIVHREDSIKEAIFTDFFLKILEVSDLEPERWLHKIEISIDFSDSQPNAKYNSTTKELIIFWKRMLEKGYTIFDMSAVTFHECVHIKQDFVDKIVIERNEDGEFIRESYEIRYTDAMWEKEMEEFWKTMSTRGVPIETGKRTEEQQQIFDYYYEFLMSEKEKMYREGIPFKEEYNKMQVKLEVEAYEKQFLYFEDLMSPDCEKEQKGNLDYFKGIYEQIKNQ